MNKKNNLLILISSFLSVPLLYYISIRYFPKINTTILEAIIALVYSSVNIIILLISEWKENRLKDKENNLKKKYNDGICQLSLNNICNNYKNFNIYKIKQKYLDFSSQLDLFEDIIEDKNEKAERCLIRAISKFCKIDPQKGEAISWIEEALNNKNNNYTEAYILKGIILANSKNADINEAFKAIRRTNDIAIYKQFLDKIGYKPIYLSCNDSKFKDANKLYVAGDFNDWFRVNEHENIYLNDIDNTFYKMHRHVDIQDLIYWDITLYLPVKEYEFKFYNPNHNCTESKKWLGWKESFRGRQEITYFEGGRALGEEDNLLINKKSFDLTSKITDTQLAQLEAAPIYEFNEKNLVFEFLWDLLNNHQQEI